MDRDERKSSHMFVQGEGLQTAPDAHKVEQMVFGRKSNLNQDSVKYPFKGNWASPSPLNSP